MPSAALHPCSYPGCPELVRHGRCKKHAAEREQQHHDPAVQRLYKTKRWQMIRRLQLAKEPWCAACLDEDHYTQATDVDHIQPHRGDPVAFYKGPFQSLCHPHHSAKTAKEVLNA